MSNFNTSIGAKQYLEIYRINQKERERNIHKNYDRRMTKDDKKKAEGKFFFRGENMNRKHLLIMIIMFIVLMIFILLTKMSKRKYTL